MRFYGRRQEHVNSRLAATTTVVVGVGAGDRWWSVPAFAKASAGTLDHRLMALIPPG